MKSKTHHAKTIDEAIDNMQDFLECDMWHSLNEEWKTEKDMLKYLDDHFSILRQEIKRIRRNNKKPFETKIIKRNGQMFIEVNLSKEFEKEMAKKVKKTSGTLK